MNKSANRKISISIIILFSISLMLIPSEADADEINVTSIGLDETAIITVTNNSDNEVKTFRVWLGDEFNFKSFKTEKGWIGEKNQQGVIIFTSSEILKPNEQVKFGLKTDKINPIINWKGLDQENKIIDKGIIKLSKLSNVNQNSNIELNQNYNNNGISIFSESTFRVIPDKPNPGSTIRITGDQFAASQKFNFYIDAEKIGNFITDSKGHFITTMKIPNIEKESRVDFKIIGHDQIERKISLKLGQDENRILEDKNIKLQIRGIPDKGFQGDILEITGTGNPGKSIVLEIIDPEQTVLNSRITTIGNAGTWKLSEPIKIPLNAMFGEYSVTVSDGRNQILKKWDIQTNKVIIINPEKIKFDPGELIKFIGTAKPNIPLELILENGLGDEMISDIIQVSDSGAVEFEYQTTENEDLEGTWTLIATQKNNKEFIYVGYDVNPTIPVNIKIDKTNYKNTEKPLIILAGKPSEKVSLIIISPSGTIVGSDTLIQLKEDGRGEYILDLSGYLSGIYTAVVKKGGSENSEMFSVGLITGSGQINSKITQTDYVPGERILLLGSTANPNSLMTLNLINPDGDKIKTLDIGSNSEGVFSEERIKIPSDGKIGLWQIIIKSGSNIDKIEFNVFSKTLEAMTIKTNEKITTGDLLKIDIVASHKTSIKIEISNEEGQNVQELMCNTTKEFKCETFWSIPKDTVPGTYKIKAYDAISSSETTFSVVMK
jgi:uncharacterized protein YfaS (alpha-2-macroglobulin family)